MLDRQYHPMKLMRIMVWKRKKSMARAEASLGLQLILTLKADEEVV